MREGWLFLSTVGGTETQRGRDIFPGSQSHGSAGSEPASGSVRWEDLDEL